MQSQILACGIWHGRGVDGAIFSASIGVLPCQLPFHKWRTPVDRQGRPQRTTWRTQYRRTRPQPTLLVVKNIKNYQLLCYSLVLRRADKHKRVCWADMQQECRVRHIDIRGVQLLTVAGCRGPQPMVWAGWWASLKNFPVWYTQTPELLCDFYDVCNLQM